MRIESRQAIVVLAIAVATSGALSIDAWNFRLTVTAGAQNWFRETRDHNNSTWTDLYIAAPGFSSRFMGHGPSA